MRAETARSMRLEEAATAMARVPVERMLARAADPTPRWQCLGCGHRAGALREIIEHVAGCAAVAA